MRDVINFLNSETYWATMGLVYGIGLVVTIVAIVKRNKKKKLKEKEDDELDDL